MFTCICKAFIKVLCNSTSQLASLSVRSLRTEIPSSTLCPLHGSPYYNKCCKVLIALTLFYHATYTSDDFRSFPILKSTDRTYKLLVLIRNQESKKITYLQTCLFIQNHICNKMKLCDRPCNLSSLSPLKFRIGHQNQTKKMKQSQLCWIRK